jgi:protein-tyrosine phosphatase
MTQIWERLFISSLAETNKLAETNRHRITTVISLCDATPQRAARGVNYLHFPISDTHPITVGTFDRIMDAVAENIRWGKLLVHCGAGSVRAPLIAASYMDVCGYKNIDEALAEVSALRPITSVSAVLLNSIKKHLP